MSESSIDAAVKAGCRGMEGPLHRDLAERAIRAAVESGHLIARDSLERVGCRDTISGVVDLTPNCFDAHHEPVYRNATPRF